VKKKRKSSPRGRFLNPARLGVLLIGLYAQGCQSTGVAQEIARPAIRAPEMEPLLRRYEARITTQDFASWLNGMRADRSEARELLALDQSLRGFLAYEGSSVGLNQYAVGLYKDSTRLFLSSEGMTPSTVRHLASVSKIFTSVAILQLMEAGKLSLTDDIAIHLPDFALATKPRDGRPITIADLMRHSSGIPYHGDGRYLLKMPVRGNSYRIAGQTRAAGKEGVYSNQNTYILGAIIEAVSGQGFPDYITQRILKPTGMEKSYVTPSANAASGIYSSVSEMLLFCRALMQPERQVQPLITRTSLERMTELPEFEGDPQKTGGFWGLGVRVRYHEGRHLEIYHNGRWTEAGGRLGYFPEEDVYLVYLGRPENFRSEDYQNFHHSIGARASRYVRVLDRLLKDRGTQLATLPDRDS